MTVIAGPVIRAARRSAAIWSRVDATDRWSVVAPREVTTTGVLGLRPAAIRAFAVLPMDVIPFSRTSVSPGSA
jgi:hypothetical protein